MDSRAYTNDQENWVPGVTTILGIIDKGDNFREWLKNNGRNADYLTVKALENGSATHDAIEKFNMDADRLVSYVEYDGEGKQRVVYNKEVWTMFGRYVDFYTRFRPRLFAVEQVLCSHERGYGGQIDMVCYLRLKPEFVKDKWLIMPCEEEILWLIDHKTGNIYQESELQTSAYAMMWNDFFPDNKIQATGVLELDASTRTEGRTGSVQGAGWSLRLHGDEAEYTRLYDIFGGVHKTWKWKNPRWKPYFASMPDRFCRGEIDNS